VQRQRTLYLIAGPITSFPKAQTFNQACVLPKRSKCPGKTFAIMKRIICLILLLCLLAIFVIAQDKPQPDRWRGMILNQTKAEDAIAKFGKPSKDKTDSLSIPQLNSWLSDRRKAKAFRSLTFKAEGFDSATLIFNEDKLVVILLDFKEKLAPAAIINAYGVELQPVVSALSEAFARPGEFERNQGRVYPKTFPPAYNLLGMSESSFILSVVNNAGFGSTLGSAMGVGSQAGTLPGKAEMVALVSRSLENRDGNDLLK
jgi:hypothetical protein